MLYFNSNPVLLSSAILKTFFGFDISISKKLTIILMWKTCWYLCLISISDIITEHLAALVTNHQPNRQTTSRESKYTHSTHSSVLLSNPWASQLHEINLFIHYWLRRATSHPTTVCGALWTIRWQDETLAHKHVSLSLSEPHTHFHLHSLPKFSRSLFQCHHHLKIDNN